MYIWRRLLKVILFTVRGIRAADGSILVTLREN